VNDASSSATPPALVKRTSNQVLLAATSRVLLARPVTGVAALAASRVLNEPDLKASVTWPDRKVPVNQ